MALFGSVSQAQVLEEFPTPSFAADPSAITAGSDGAVWFTEDRGRAIEGRTGAIGRIDREGAIVEFDIPGRAFDLVTGPDGELWFPILLTGGGWRLGRMTTAGAYSEIRLQGDPRLGGFITVGSDGNFWVNEYPSKVLRVMPSGSYTEFSLPEGHGASNLVTGPDGVWSLTYRTAPGDNSQSVARITQTGVVTEFPLFSKVEFPGSITAGLDGRVWVGATPSCGFIPNRSLLCGVIARIDPDGEVTHFSAPDLGIVNGITNGIDGNLWFTSGANSCTYVGWCQSSPRRFGRITPDGIVTQFDLGHDFTGGFLGRIVTGPDGNLYFTETDRSVIGRVRIGSPCRADDHSLCLNGGRFRTQVSWRVTDPQPRGLGTGRTLTADTGAYWFFSENNLEVVVKVLDGRAANGKFWVFVGSLTDVEYEVTVTDTTTGQVRRYQNQAGSLLTVADTEAF
jgi:streptogramin lyase